MNVRTVRIAIIGGGLAGLYAARLLEQHGIHDYVVLEARPAWGGRIASIAPTTGSPLLDRFDLGPTWFWPVYQRELGRLIDSLGLKCFAQHEEGDMVVEYADARPKRVRGYGSEPPSVRLAGGMGALIDAIRTGLDSSNLISGQSVRRLRCNGVHVELDAEDDQGHSTSYRTEHVLLAVPPRLAAATIDFSPALPEAVTHAWRDTATWMAPHAKYIAIYDEPFWRDQGLSGEARSAKGPLGEIHDASIPGGSAALFGFFGVPAHVRRGVPEEVLRAHCRAQFARLFGAEASTPKADFIKDWAADPCTATPLDAEAATHHANAPIATVQEGEWRNRIVGIASEWSTQFPGYVAGAIDAAERGVQALLPNLTEVKT